MRRSLLKVMEKWTLLMPPGDNDRIEAGAERGEWRVIDRG